MDKEHILVCLSSAPSNAKIIRAASRMANAYKGVFTALYVETPDFNVMSEENQQRLRLNMQYAQELGAKLEVIYGDDVPFLIAEFARLSGVTSIVIGRSSVKKRLLPGRLSLTERLIEIAPDLDIHIIPDVGTDRVYYKKKTASVWSWKDVFKSILALVIATGIGLIFEHLGFSEANIIMIYILAVLVISIITTQRAYSLISSLVSVLVFNFFFTIPRYTLLAYHQEYPVTFLIMFLAAFITSTLAGKLKNSAKQSAQAAYRTRILFETNQILQQAADRNSILISAGNQITKLLGKSIVIYVVEEERLRYLQDFSVMEKQVGDSRMTKQESDAAYWAFQNKKRAGASTEIYPDAKYLYYAIRVNDNVYGVLGILLEGRALDAFENSVLTSILGECALALENEMNAREKEEAKLVAQNEQLRANLLRSISHDLRTPLTSISGNASNLALNSLEFDEDTKKQIYEDIYDDSMWLINLVENLLAITKIEEGKVKLRMTTELIDEVIAEALQHVSRKKVEHEIIVENPDEFLLAKMDSKLIVQVLINIIDNAIKYTPVGSVIRIRTEKKGIWVCVSISDNGDGISDEVKTKIFDMFYSGSNKLADSRRSLGLGLYLCKSIIAAHGGIIEVLDNNPKGAVFRFTLLAEEVSLHE